MTLKKFGILTPLLAGFFIALISALPADAQRKLPPAAIDGRICNAQTYTELTIASGSITVSLCSHLVDTESDASTDDLTTVVPWSGIVAGQTVDLSLANAARDVVIKNGSGTNLILTPNNVDYSLGELEDIARLRWTGSQWRLLLTGGGAADNVDGYATYSALEAVAFAKFTDGDYVAIADDTRGGLFRVDTGNLSTLVTADPGQCVVIANPADASGGTGGYVRDAYLQGESINNGWCDVPGDGTDQSSEIDNLVDMAEYGPYFDARRITLGPGEFRADTLAFTTADQGVQIVGQGEHVTEISTDTDAIGLVSFGVAHASARTQSYALRDVTLSYNGSGDTSAGSFVSLINTQKALIKDVTIDGAFDGITCDACQHTNISGLRTSAGGRSSAASSGIIFQSSQEDLNAAGNYISDTELSYGAAGGAGVPNEGIYVRNADGLYVSNFHTQGADIGYRITPEAGTTNDYAISILNSNIYLDSADTNNLLITGQADSGFGQILFSNFEFRNAGGNGANVNPGITAENLLFSNGVIKQTDQTGFLIGANVNGLLMNNIAFEDNNEANGNYTDLDIRGEDVTLIGARFAGGDEDGSAIQIRSTANNVRIIGANFTDSVAGTLRDTDEPLFDFATGSGSMREMQIHASSETTQVRRFDRDFYHDGGSSAGATATAFEYETTTGEGIQLTAVVSCQSDGTDWNFYEESVAAENSSGTVTLVRASTNEKEDEEDAVTGGVGTTWIVSGSGSGTSLLLRIKTGAGVGTSYECSGEVRGVSSLH